MYFADSLPPELEERRRELVARRARLMAMAISDPDPELKTQIEEVEQALRRLDQPWQQ